MARLLEIAQQENYDEFKVEVNSKLQVLFDKKVYMLSDDNIVSLKNYNAT